MYFLEFEDLKQILNLNEEILCSVLKKTYLIDAGPHDLMITGMEINDLLGKDLLEPYSLHLIANFTVLKNVIAKLGVEPSYLEELEEMDEDTFKNLQSESFRLRDNQENYFENSLIFKIRKVSSSEDVARGYEDYINYLDGFNLVAFNEVIETILKEEEEVIAGFQTQFDYIPKYLIEKYRLGKLRQAVASEQSNEKDLEVKIKNLQETTEASLGKIIQLFNELNVYALLNRIAKPYPFKYKEILVNNEDHRKDVQKLLIKHSPIYISNI